MQNTQASLKRPLNVHDIPPSALKALVGRRLKRSPHLSINKEFLGPYTSKLRVSFAKEGILPLPSENTLKNQNSLVEEDHIKAKRYLSTITDPLWKHVCGDVIYMMGPASFLKIWDSTLGEVCAQSQSMEIRCQTEETAQFIEQYDFVILGSLQPYFPALKQLRVKTISTL